MKYNDRGPNPIHGTRKSNKKSTHFEFAMGIEQQEVSSKSEIPESSNFKRNERKPFPKPSSRFKITIRLRKTHVDLKG